MRDPVAIICIAPYSMSKPIATKPNLVQRIARLFNLKKA